MGVIQESTVEDTLRDPLQLVLQLPLRSREALLACHDCGEVEYALVVQTAQGGPETGELRPAAEDLVIGLTPSTIIQTILEDMCHSNLALDRLPPGLPKQGDQAEFPPREAGEALVKLLIWHAS